MQSRLFHYWLPKEMIAQALTRPRNMCRLLLCRHPSGEVGHFRFRDLPRVLPPRPIIVLNRTRVIPAKLELRKRSGGRLEALIVELGEEGPPLAYLKGKVREGVEALGDDGVILKVGRHLREGLFEVTLSREGEELKGRRLLEVLKEVGRMPLPPYIKRRDIPEEEYQTVYASSDGSIAAPTAGLHFTEQLMEELKRGGADICYVELHVGPGTFLPLRSERVEEHKMEGERYLIPPREAERIKSGLEEGRPLVAVGTTTVRALESASSSGHLRRTDGVAEVFIRPPYRFSLPYSAFITNFHLPLSTPLLLLSSFIPWERVYSLYMEAICRGYRFYSLGDAMMIIFEGGVKSV
ncbi:MAG: tRNA preQ1(34) S-adenosylmethionine ribosyltransferase-isomerase QueA [Thermoplasmata archaeon]|nr:tRNA preQ1(34) S-adenosylmethionine ribosyltransferase-isomerase QueA [Thermoplasmata archaeon]